MSALTYTVIDLDFPVGDKNKTATLITGDDDALLVDAGFTRADGHRLVAAVLDSGKKLRTVYISHSDPDFYFGLEVVADAFPDAALIATPLVIQHIRDSYQGKLVAWAALGLNLPTRSVDLQPLTGDLELEGRRLQLKGAHPDLPDRSYLWQAEDKAIVGGVLLFDNEHVWTADTATPARRSAWIEVLDDMAALDPAFAVPGHRRPDLAVGTTSIAYTREYLLTFEQVIDAAADGAAATQTLIERYPHAGMRIAAQLGPKVAKGEMTWGSAT